MEVENNPINGTSATTESGINREQENTNQTDDERVIDDLLRSNLLTQAVSAGAMADPLCKKLGVNCVDVHRPKIPYSEFVNEVINNGTCVFFLTGGSVPQAVRNLLAEFFRRNFEKNQKCKFLK